MDEELKKRFEEMEVKLDATFKSVERMRQYFKWTLIVTVVTIVLPLIALAFVIPMFLKSFDYSSLGL